MRRKAHDMLLTKDLKLIFSFHSVYIIQGAKPKTQ
jgi:hypothetical protein